MFADRYRITENDSDIHLPQVSLLQIYSTCVCRLCFAWSSKCFSFSLIGVFFEAAALKNENEEGDDKKIIIFFDMYFSYLWKANW